MKELKDTQIQFLKVKTAVLAILLILAVFALIFGQSFTKNIEIYKTSNDFDLIIRQKNPTPLAVENSDYVSVASGNDSNFVHIGGTPIGIAITAGGLIVVGDGGVMTGDGESFPSRNIIRNGDVVLSVNGEKVSSIYQLKKILSETQGEVSIELLRDERVQTVKILPAVERITGQRKLGLALKEDVGGIGTLTFVTQNGGFAALGHYINDAETGLDAELNSGNIYKTDIEGVEKGEIGKAGGLVAGVNRLSSPIGKIKANTNIGLYGEFSGETNGSLVRVASKGEAKPGRAQVLTTVDGSEPKFYDIEIVKVISQSEPGDKGMVILVRDKELLEKTGGIVQGMSGSPIVQNGVFVGAVTHVFIQDPTRGYAVHARFMFDEAERVVAENSDKNDNQTAPNIEDFDLAA